MDAEKLIVIASDGSGIKNPDQECGYDATYAFVVKDLEKTNEGWLVAHEFSKSKFIENTTNNVGEIKGYRGGLNFLLDGAIPNTIPIIMVLDSEYTMNCIHKWFKAWKKSEIDGVAYRNDWKHNKKIPVKNWDLIKETRKKYELLEKLGYNIKTLHVHSHICEEAMGAELYRICSQNKIEIDPVLFNIIIDANNEADELCTKAQEEYEHESED